MEEKWTTNLHPAFDALLRDLQPRLELLKDCTPHSGGKTLPPGVPSRAVYLFSDGDAHLYVGRTNRLRARYREHCRGKQNDAPFAFKWTKHLLGLPTKGGLTRAGLMADATFSDAFVLRKTAVSDLQFRWVEETDKDRQCLLEIYAALALGAPFNDFENH